MKLWELQQREIEHLRTAEHGSDLDEWLEERGWEEISYGATAYSNVWSKQGSNWVIKILRLSVMPTPAFKCAIQWLRFANKNHHTNPHLPVVAYVKTAPGEYLLEERAYMAVIERLEDSSTFKWKRSGNRKQDAFDIACFYIFGLSGQLKWTDSSLNTAFMDIIAEVGNVKEIEDRARHLYGERGIYDGSGDTEDHLRWLSEMSTKAGMRNSLAKEMVKHGAFKGHQLSGVISMILNMEDNCRLDMHAGNIMVRPSTNTLVVTDPVMG